MRTSRMVALIAAAAMLVNAEAWNPEAPLFYSSSQRID